MNTQSFSFDVSKQPLATPILYLGQGDKNGTTIEAEIYDNGAPLALTNYSVRFSMRLPDDVSYYSVNGTVSGNVATIPINEEYAAVFVGQTSVAYIEVFSGTTLICSTNRIDVVVLPSAESNASPSTAYSDEITEATNRANEAAAAAEGVILQSMPTMSTTIKGGAICGDGLKMSGDSVGVDAATNTRIDAITADDNPQGSEAITITGLNRFWANIKQAFAAIVHGHAISDVDGLQTALNGKLPLSGGTLTDNLYLQDGTIDRDAAANPSGQVGRQLVFVDKDGERIGLVRVDRNAGGYMALKLGAFTEDSNNQEVAAWLSLTKARDGDPCVLMPKSVVRDTDYSASGNPDANRWMTIAEGQDSTGADRAYVKQTATRDGWQGAQLEAHRGSTYNGLRMEIDKDGNRRVIVSDAAAWRSGLGLGSLATKSSAALDVKAPNNTATSTAARTANTNFTIDVTVPAESGYTPTAIIAVKLNEGPATVMLRGFDLDGIGVGNAATVHTYWHTSAAIASGTKVTAFAQVMYLRGTAS